MNDTHPEAERIWIDLLRRAGPEKRLAMAIELTDRVVRTAQSAVARAHPHLSPLEQKLLLAEVGYGRELADRVREYLLKREPAA